MDLSSFQQLFTVQGQAALQAAVALNPTEESFLAHFKSLAGDFPYDLARAALEIAIERRKATVKFGDAATRLYFNRECREQASSSEVARYRAARYKSFEVVMDLGCAAGADSIELARVARVSGFDRDELRVAMAAANAAALGMDERCDFFVRDITEPLPAHPARLTALFFDPARRSNERRAPSVEKYEPPLSVIRSWLKLYPSLGVKLSPAVKLRELHSYEEEFDPEVEFISVGGELKEAVMWFGDLRSTPKVARRATVLPGSFTLVEDRGARLGTRTSAPRAFLYEPDPSVIRAGLVRTLAGQLDGAQMDRDIAFITADKESETPLARAWAIEDWMPFGLKRLRTWLRERSVGRVTVKKRGSPIQTDSFVRNLRLQGDDEKMIVLTQMDDKPIILICEPRPRGFKDDA